MPKGNLIDPSEEELELDLNKKTTILWLIARSGGLLEDFSRYKPMALITVEKYHEYYKSIIITDNYKIFSSTKSTRELMFSYTNQMGLPYRDYLDLIALDQRHYKIPYIYKHIIALPEGGVTRKSCNWYFLNYMEYYVRKDYSDRIILKYQDLKIVTKIGIETFKNQLETILTIYASQWREYKQWMVTVELRKSYLFNLVDNERPNRVSELALSVIDMNRIERFKDKAQRWRNRSR